MAFPGEPPLARLSAAFAIVVAMAACADTAPDDTDGPAAPPAVEQPAPAPDTAPEPAPDPLDALTPEARATREALLEAAGADDWDAVASLIPTDAMFTSNYGGETDHVAYYRGLDEDVLAEVVLLLEAPFDYVGDIQVGEVFVWPELHARVPFVVSEDERASLIERYGADALADWEAAEAYLGWRIGITTDGDWLFLVSGTSPRRSRSCCDRIGGHSPMSCSHIRRLNVPFGCRPVRSCSCATAREVSGP